MRLRHRALVTLLMASLMLAAWAMWQSGGLDAWTSVTLLAFAVLGAGLLLPRVYHRLCIGVAAALPVPWADLTSGRVTSLEAVSKSDVVLAFVGPVLWFLLVAWAVGALASIAFGAWKVLKHHAA